MKSAYCFYPDNNRARLGPDAAAALEDAKIEDAINSEKVEAGNERISGDIPEGEAAEKSKKTSDKVPTKGADVVAPTEALPEAPLQDVISPIPQIADEVQKSSSIPVVP